MNALILWIILFTFVLDMCVNASSFSYDQAYHTEKKTWKVASDECGRDGLEFDKNVLTSIDVLYGKEFWIGMAIYRVTTPWIEILGCYAIPDGQEVTKSPSIVFCQKQCESYQFFGYSESTTSCTCLHAQGSSYSLQNCIEHNNSTYLFVYKVFSGNVSGDYNNGKCTTLYCYGGTNGLTAVDCYDHNVETASTCNDGSIVGWGMPYSTGKRRCLDSNQLLLQPETHCLLKGRENEALVSWTNVFRFETDAKLTQAEAGTTEPLNCLAGSFTENYYKIELNITRRVCDNQLEFVCRIGNTSYTTQSQSTVVSRTIQKGSMTSFNIGVVIGGILGACSMIIMLAVMIVCKIRSKGIFTDSNTHNYEDTSRVNFSTATYEDLANAKHTNLTATTNQACDISDSSAPVYEEVNKN